MRICAAFRPVRVPVLERLVDRAFRAVLAEQELAFAVYNLAQPLVGKLLIFAVHVRPSFPLFTRQRYFLKKKWAGQTSPSKMV